MTGPSGKDDPPFYNGQSVDLGARGWLIVIPAVIVAVFQLILLPLPTFPLNILQCLGTIGGARLILTASYLVTRNVGS